MKKFNKKFLSPLFVIVGTSMSMYAVAQMTVSHAAEPSQTWSSKEVAYQEIERNGRLYVFASPTRKAEFEKSGELRVAIIKTGYVQEDGETIIFDSEDALKKYDNRH